MAKISLKLDEIIDGDALRRDLTALTAATAGDGSGPAVRTAVLQLPAGVSVVSARMYWSGTHRGDYRGHPATGRSVAYPGMAVFRFADGLITEVWAVGDTHGLWSVIT